MIRDGKGRKGLGLEGQTKHTIISLPSKFNFNMVMSQINHPQLGRLTGTSQDGISYFRGIKYASLDHAFAAPNVYSERAADGPDATQHG